MVKLARKIMQYYSREVNKLAFIENNEQLRPTDIQVLRRDDADICWEEERNVCLSQKTISKLV
jgi:hypothetical protein